MYSFLLIRTGDEAMMRIARESESEQRQREEQEEVAKDKEEKEEERASSRLHYVKES